MADPQLTLIDDLLREDHAHLGSDHRCYFMREYTSRQGYAYSETNDLIHNFKKPAERRGRPEWAHKERALQRLAKELRVAISEKFLTSVTLVPMPPSRARNDPLYDDRMTRLLSVMTEGLDADVRELLLQPSSTTPAHETEERRDPARIAANLLVNDAAAAPSPRTIAVFDDVLTTGAHFSAASIVLRRAFPDSRVIGIFIARRVFPSDP